MTAFDITIRPFGIMSPRAEIAATTQAGAEFLTQFLGPESPALSGKPSIEMKLDDVLPLLDRAGAEGIRTSIPTTYS